MTGRARNPEQRSLSQQATSGVLWTAAQKWGMRLGGLVTVIILARLLSPEEFGLVAVALAFVPVIYLFADLGFSTYVVQADNISRPVLSTAFWYGIGAAGVLGGALFLASPLIAKAVGIPEAARVIAALAPTVLLVAVSSVPIALLRRRLAFRVLALQSFLASATSQLLAVILALNGWGVWALVAQLVVSQLVVAVLALATAGFRPSRTFSTTEFAKMFRFGVNVIGVEVVAMTRVWAEAAIVASSLGVTGLGFLNIAQRLIQATQDLSAAAVVPVSTVVFAQIRSARERLAIAYVRALETIYLVVMPIMVMVSVSSPLLLPMLFGDQWERSIAPSQALAVAGALTLAASLDAGLFYGCGRPGRWLAYAVAIDVLTVLTTVVAVRYGLLGISLGFVCVAAVATVTRWFLVAHLLSVPVARVMLPLVTALGPALTGAAAGIVAIRVGAPLPMLVLLGVVGVSILVAHVGAARLLMPRRLDQTIALVKDALSRRRAAGEGPSGPLADERAGEEVGRRDGNG